jgi:hypothetical protein
VPVFPRNCGLRGRQKERASDPSDGINERSPNKKESKFDGTETPTLKHLPPPAKKKLGGACGEGRWFAGPRDQRIEKSRHGLISNFQGSAVWSTATAAGHFSLALHFRCSPPTPLSLSIYTPSPEATCFCTNFPFFFGCSFLVCVVR